MRVDDHEVEQIIGQLLRAGVLLAAMVVLVGAVLYLRQSAHQYPHYHTFRGVAGQLKSITGVAHGVAALDPESIIQLGLLLLIATPVARVAFSVAAFALEHDAMYVIMTLIVLGVLLFSLIRSA